MHTLERQQTIPVPREELFEFFEDPRNLGKMTPKGMDFRILKMDQLPVRVGFRIKYRIKVLGVSLRWLTTITEHERGRRFVDDQTSGPYAYWRHEHTFEDVDGSTLMRDRVQYELPLGVLGSAVHRLIVARELRRIFDFRARTIRELFDKPSAAAWVLA